MASKLTMFPRLNPKNEDEAASHFFAREGQTMLRHVVRALVLITAIFMIFLWLWVAIPVTFLLIAYGLLMLTNVAEERTRGAGDDAEGAEDDESAAPMVATTAHPQPRFEAPVDGPIGDGLPLPVLKREVILIAAAVLVVGGIASALSIALFGWLLAPITIPVIFAYMTLLSWPAWVAALSADAEERGG
jgi:hypothetical protein